MTVFSEKNLDNYVSKCHKKFPFVCHKMKTEAFINILRHISLEKNVIDNWIKCHSFVSGRTYNTI